MSNVDLRIYDPTKVRGLFDELRERLDEATAENRRLRIENERLLSLCQQWSENCTRNNGSQYQCVRS